MIALEKIIKWLIELIKRFIKWLLNLFKNKKRKKKVQRIKKDQLGKSKTVVTNIDAVFNSTLPVYMIINDSEKEKLMYNVSILKNVLLEKNAKRKELEEKKLVSLIEEECNVKVSELLDQKYIDTLVKDLDPEIKKEIVDKYQDIVKTDIDFKEHIKEIDKVIELINKNDISIVSENEIEREISDIVNDKNIDNLEEKVDEFDTRVFDIIENFDKDFIDEVVKEYKTVNYITIATTIIDKNYERFKKLEEDFKNHRLNRYYYEREINKIKNELNQIKNLKSKKEVRDHIEKLKRELNTKSKDKYDLLYNNEVFIDINKRCDILLDKVNTRVIDIKETKEKKEEKEKTKENEIEENREKYYENVLLRFQDLNLSQKLIFFHQQIKLGKINNEEIDLYLDSVYADFVNGVDGPFNYERNRVKTELVNLYNDLNGIIAKSENKAYDIVTHSNFLMEDLVEAVTAKKQEVDDKMKTNKTPNSFLVDEKLESISEKYIEKKDEKVFSKGSRRAA